MIKLKRVTLFSFLILSLLYCGLVPFISAGWNPYILLGLVTDITPTLFRSNPTYYSYGALGYNAGEFYEGGGFKDAAAAHSLVRVDACLRYFRGDVTTKHFECSVWTVAVSWELVTLLGTSDAVVGVNEWDGTWVTFTFSTPVTLAINTDYGIVIAPQEAPDTANCIFLDEASENTFGGYLGFAFWGTDYVKNWYDGVHGPRMKLYEQL